MHPRKDHWKEYSNTDTKSLPKWQAAHEPITCGSGAEGEHHCIKGYKDSLQANESGQICPQLRELGVKIFPTRCPACNNMVRLFGEHLQIKAVTKTEDHKVGKVQTVAGFHLMSSDAPGITD